MGSHALYPIFGNLTPFEGLMGVSYSDMIAGLGDTVSAAKTQMKFTKLPTYFVDIFNRSVLDDAKALFSPEYKKDPTPGFGFSALRRRCVRTLEGYFVDKHLSSSISSEFIIEVISRIERAVNDHLQRDKGIPDNSYKGTFYSDNIQSFGVRGDTYVKSFRELNVEVSFMFRIVERLRVQEETKLFAELPLPKFKNPENLDTLKRAIDDIQTCSAILTIHCHISKKEPDDLRLLTEYETKLYDLRDERVLKILKDSLQKDLAVRKTNPNAPLMHLVTIEKYEKAINKERQKLAAKIAIAVFAIFFCSSVLHRYYAR